jgi:hypothetical protein
MLTLFTTGKPFVGHNGVIQRNALKSWTLLHRDVEVILFGNDEGAADAAKELGIRHERHTEKNETGLNRANFLFGRAQAIARHEILCYSNCDIILLQDFRSAVERVAAAHRQFLMVGRRWDTDVTQPRDFTSPDWQTRLRNLALQTNNQRTPDWIDYFVFRRGLFTDMPPLVVGRPFWDNWTVWKALDFKTPVVDASRAVVAIHQNHDYRHHPGGLQGVLTGAEGGENHKATGGWRHLRTIADAGYVLHADGLKLKPNFTRHWAAVKRYLRQASRVALYRLCQPVWFFLLGITRPLRNLLGLRATPIRRSAEKV